MLPELGTVTTFGEGMVVNSLNANGSVGRVEGFPWLWQRGKLGGVGNE